MSKGRRIRNERFKSTNAEFIQSIAHLREMVEASLREPVCNEATSARNERAALAFKLLDECVDTLSDQDKHYIRSVFEKVVADDTLDGGVN